VAVSGCLWSSILGEGDASRVTEKDVVPYLDIHGDADVQVGTWDSLFTYKYLESLGVPSENNRLVIVPGGGHVPWGDVEKERLRPVVMDFLIRQLHLENAECNGV
jgi:pimeloyl-ACP methyl ester carboxylesterase